ncbi:MAG TPA: sulfopyruvate decarboxylase subunit beta [Methanobacterium sp.]|nr:sulfopyruvate decarboxylase subunit beta [Methanobacterium sp.]
MKRIDALKIITSQLKDELVICNIGFPSRELYSVKDSVNHFYMLGSMGMASSIGLGLAMAQKRKVVALDGDGSLLMNLGSLVTIYNQKPENFILVVLDNECYGSTGSQCTYASTVDLSRLAEAVGFKNIFTFHSNKEEKLDFKKVLKSKGPVFVHVKVEAGNANVPVINMEPEEIKERFMKELN